MSGRGPQFHGLAHDGLMTRSELFGGVPLTAVCGAGVMTGVGTSIRWRRHSL